MSLEDKIEELAAGETQLRNWLNGLEDANDAQKAAIAEWAESAEKGDGKGFWKAFESTEEEAPAEEEEAPAEEEEAPEALPNRQASADHRPKHYSGYPTIAR